MPNSRAKVENKISAFLDMSATVNSITGFDSIEALLSAEIFDLYIIHTSQRKHSDTLVKYIKREDEISFAKNEKYRFITFSDDPISDDDCTKVIACIKRFIEYDSAYLALEIMTDKGLISIATSKILFFEYVNKKVKIKTQMAEYICSNTLKYLLSVLENHTFHQPHKSFIVNFKHISNIKNYAITMNDGSLIPLSQKQSKEFRKLYKFFLENNATKIKKLKNNKTEVKND